MKKCVLLISVCFSSVILFAENIYSKYMDNGKYGLIDKNRKIVLKAEFDEIKYNEVYLCKNKEKGNYVYDSKLNLIYEFDSEDKNIIMTSPRFFYVKRGYAINERGYILDIKNNTAVNVQDKFFEGNNSAEPWISSQNRYYSSDFQTELFSSYHTNPYRNKRAVILNNQKESEVIDENFSTVVSHIYGAANLYSEGLLPVVFFAEDGNSENLKKGKSCYIDLNGKIVYECDFDFNTICVDTIKHMQNNLVYGSYIDGVAVVQKSDSSWIILDRNFKKYNLPEGCEIESIISHDYSNGLLLVFKEVNGNIIYGYLDKKCNVAIPFDYSYAEQFDGKYAIVIKDGKEGVIDAKGKFFANVELK